MTGCTGGAEYPVLPIPHTRSATEGEKTLQTRTTTDQQQVPVALTRQRRHYPLADQPNGTGLIIVQFQRDFIEAQAAEQL
jgi:hypothetical protein